MFDFGRGLVGFEEFRAWGSIHKELFGAIYDHMAHETKLKFLTEKMAQNFFQFDVRKQTYPTNLISFQFGVSIKVFPFYQHIIIFDSCIYLQLIALKQLFVSNLYGRLEYKE